MAHEEGTTQPADAGQVQRPVRPRMPPYLHGRDCAALERVVPIADVEAYVVACIAAAVASDRERLARVVREFPHWLGPQAKRELLAAMGLEA